MIPVYSLYGEARGAEASAWMHWETIPARSRLHGYRIAPHRHAHFLQILHVTRGAGAVWIDASKMELEVGSIVVLPAWTVHAFEFQSDIDGQVFTLKEQDLADTGLALPKAGRYGMTAGLQAALARLVAEAEHFGAGYDVAMRACIALLAVELHRLAQSRTDLRDAKALAFKEMVEQRFRQSRSVAEYASALGLSQTHLGRLCRAAFDASPLEVIEARVGLEARRLLLFSGMSIKEMADYLGYEDPAYFSRTMRKILGVPPSVLRAEGLNVPPPQPLEERA